MAKKTSKKRENRRVNQEEYNHIDPPHYQVVLKRSPTCSLPVEEVPLQAIDVIEAFGFAQDGHLSHALTYLLRLSRKPGAADVQDLKKARWWISRAISYREGHPQEE